MVDIGSGAQRKVEDWALARYACYIVIQNAVCGSDSKESTPGLRLRVVLAV